MSIDCWVSLSGLTYFGKGKLVLTRVDYIIFLNIKT